MALLFWGLWLLPLGYLVYESRFLPRFLGVWLGLAGLGWMILCFTGVLLPENAGKLNTYFQPFILGEIAFMLWLVIKRQATADRCGGEVGRNS